MNKKGILLFEVMISILIVAGSLIFITRAYSSSNKASARSKELIESVFLIQEKLFEIEVQAQVEEASISGGFSNNENYSWKIDSQSLEGSKLRMVTLGLFKKDQTQDPGYQLYTYFKSLQP